MNIVFHGRNAAVFRPGLEALLDALPDTPHRIDTVSDALDGAGEAAIFAAADVIVGVALTPAHQAPATLKLYQAPAAGVDAIDVAALPGGAALCNAYGHEIAIAEYVMTALLSRHVPLADADARLRAGDWRYLAGAEGGLRSELGSQSIGIIGYGHIGKSVAARAAAFGMKVHVANRTPVADPAGLAGLHALPDLAAMMGQVDVVLNTLPLMDDTRGMIGARELAAMRAHAIILNVGRGAVIDEDALFDALERRAIGGAIIDTWYVYPGAGDAHPMPGHRPFHTLPNLVMTPHMSAWTEGTVARRRATIADNVNRLARGEPLINRVR